MRTVVAGLMLVASTTFAQTPRTSVLVAHVVDALTGEPVRNAEIWVSDLRRGIRTSDSGEARIYGVPLAFHQVLVRQLGYTPVDNRMEFDSDTVERLFRLHPTTKILDTLKVTEKNISLSLRDFEIRRAMGVGHFLDDNDLAREGTREFALTAQTRLPGLRAITSGDGRYRIASLRGNCGSSRALGEIDSGTIGSSRMGSGGGGKSASMVGSCSSSTPCFVQVYLDGVKVNSDIELVRTSELYGVEYYTGASMPVQYRISGSACGVLLAWTRPVNRDD
jgi:hypothetical protein